MNEFLAQLDDDELNSMFGNVKQEQPKKTDSLARPSLEPQFNRINNSPAIPLNQKINNTSDSTLSPQQKQQVYDSLLARFDKVNNEANENYDKARGDIDNSQMVNNLLKAVSMAGNANSVSRGNKGPDYSVFDSVEKGLQGKISDSQNERKKAIEDYLMRDRLSQEDKNRSRIDAKEKRMNDPSSIESKSYQQLFKKLNPNMNVDGMSASQLAPLMDTNEKIYGIDQQRLIRQESAAQRREDRADKREERAFQLSQKQGDYNDSVRVEGANVKPGFKPTVDDAKKMKEAKANYDTMKSSLERLDALYKKSGTDFVGDDAAAKEAVMTDLQLSVKNLAQLGVLSKSDIEMIEKMVPNPTSFWENTKGLFGADSYQARSKEFGDAMKNKYESAMKAHGYELNSPKVEAERKTLNGITYEKVAGGWKRVN